MQLKTDEELIQSIFDTFEEIRAEIETLKKRLDDLEKPIGQR